VFIQPVRYSFAERGRPVSRWRNRARAARQRFSRQANGGTRAGCPWARPARPVGAGETSGCGVLGSTGWPSALGREHVGHGSGWLRLDLDESVRLGHQRFVVETPRDRDFGWRVCLYRQ
jgi:hypothetical protein